MAAPQSATGGQPEGFQPKSFAELFSKKPDALEVRASFATHRGESSVAFDTDVIDSISKPFQFALVGKFSKGRPSMDDLRKFFVSLDHKDAFTVGLLDPRHVLIRLQ